MSPLLLAPSSLFPKLLTVLFPFSVQLRALVAVRTVTENTVDIQWLKPGLVPSDLGDPNCNRAVISRTAYESHKFTTLPLSYAGLGSPGCDPCRISFEPERRAQRARSRQVFGGRSPTSAPPRPIALRRQSPEGRPGYEAHRAPIGSSSPVHPVRTDRL